MLAAPLAPFLARRGVHYGWVMVAATFLTMLATAAAMGMPGVLLLPLQREYGWTAADISGPLALRLLLFGLMAPFSAALLARYGLRRTVGAAMCLIVGGLGLSTGMTELWQLVRLAGQAFGRERAPVVFGWVFTAHQLGAAVAALGAGVSRDALSSYLPAFYLAGAACLLAALAVLAARPGAARGGTPGPARAAGAGA